MHFEKYIGNLAQVFAVKTYALTGGKQDGVKAVDICNGAGLELTVLPDRCMDLYQVKYKGINLNYITPSGIVAPSFYDANDNQWLRSFFAGFMTTCGLMNIGSDCEDDYGKTGIHGRIANIPAEHFNVLYDNTPEGPVVTLQGVMREAVLFGAVFSLTREITVAYGKNEIVVRDVVKNEGYRKMPHMMLYHCNMGYPFLQECCKLKIPTRQVTPRNSHALEELPLWDKVTSPVEGAEESCFFHEIEEVSPGVSKVALENPALGIGLELAYSSDTLPRFTQWRLMGAGEYVLGLEPCNASIDGRSNAAKDGTLRFLESGEQVTYTLKFTIYDVE